MTQTLFAVPFEVLIKSGVCAIIHEGMGRAAEGGTIQSQDLTPQYRTTPDSTGLWQLGDADGRSGVGTQALKGRQASWHYSDVILSTMASQITIRTVVHSTVCSSADHRKNQSSASLASVRGIHRWPVTGDRSSLIINWRMSLWQMIRVIYNFRWFNFDKASLNIVNENGNHRERQSVIPFAINLETIANCLLTHIYYQTINS